MLESVIEDRLSENWTDHEREYLECDSKGIYALVRQADTSVRENTLQREVCELLWSVPDADSASTTNSFVNFTRELNIGIDSDGVRNILPSGRTSLLYLKIAKAIDSLFSRIIVASESQAEMEACRRVCSVLDHEEQGRLDEALDLLYDIVDDLLLLRDYKAVDRILFVAIKKAMSVELALGFLTITLLAKDKLSYRTIFMRKVAQDVELCGADVADVLRGLE